MKRLRWCLIVAVLVVTAEFARMSIATLAPQSQIAAATVEPDRPVGTVANVAEPRTAGAARMQEPPGTRSAGASSQQPGGTVAIADDLAPRSSEQPGNDVPSQGSVASVDREAERQIESPQGAGPDSATKAEYLHPAILPLHLAAHHGVSTWQFLASSADRLRCEPLPSLWTNTSVPHHAEAPEAGDEFSLPIERSIRDHSPANAPSAGAPRLVLKNARGSGGDVHFLVGEKSYSLSPGETLEWTGQERWLVRFHRGGALGDAAHSLWPGSYEFSVGSGGWDLVRQTR